MNLKISKIKAYIGFAIKSRQIKYGVDDIIKQINCRLIITSNLLAESSSNKLKKFSEKTHCDIINFSNDEFLELFDGNQNIRAVAILDDNLAKAINKEYD